MENFCQTCNSEIQYNSKHDAYYCELCNEWTEDTCTDRDCEFCKDRPNKPSQVIEE